MRVIFRVDSSSVIGSGHLMRCLSLAKLMQQQNWEVSFICRAHKGNLNALIIQQEMNCIELPRQPSLEENLSGYQVWLGCSENDDAEACLAQLSKSVDLLIVDHYALGEMFCKRLRRITNKIMMIDDLANRQHDCDILLDQNLLPNSQLRYLGKVREGCALLLGPAYALLREEFFSDLKRQSDQRRVLVFFGAADQQGLTVKALKAINNIKEVKFYTDIVINNTHKDKDWIIQYCKCRPNFKVHIQTQNMAQLMLDADFMLGAGGATHWERCATGLPSLCVTLAENQLDSTAYLHELGMCEWIGRAHDMTVERIQQKLSLYLVSDKKLLKMREQIKGVMSETESGTTKVLTVLTKMFYS